MCSEDWFVVRAGRILGVSMTFKYSMIIMGQLQL